MHRRIIVPSRVNIIGEHTDYAGGLALPFATEKFLELTIKSRDYGCQGDQTVVKLWQAVSDLPVELTIESNIPIGKGMSSSAALCLAIVIGAKPNLSKLEIHNLDVGISNSKDLIGKHDFVSFCSTDSSAASTTRVVYEVHFNRNGPLVDFWIVGQGFLKQMVRIIVGTLIDIAKRENDLSISEIIKKNDRSYAGKTAPSKGLFFLGPTYSENFAIDSLELDIFNRLKS